MWKHLKKKERKTQQEASIPIAKIAYQIHGIANSFSEDPKKNEKEFDDFTLHKFEDFEDYFDFSEEFSTIFKELRQEKLLPNWVINASFSHESLSKLFK